MKDNRLLWVDHLRTFIIFLVVVVHACVTYSHVGSWYVMSKSEPTPAVKLGFLLVEGHAQSFFMGTLFFFAGYFAHGSLQKRGARGFLRERLMRLGLPTLFFMWVIHPFILLGLNPWQARFPSPIDFYSSYLTSGRFLGCSGPLWFAFALLIFCSVLAAWRSVRPILECEVTAPPGYPACLLFGLGLVAATFLVRLVQPIGSSVLNFQLCFFPQYLAAFAVGLAAARGNWLSSLAQSSLARRLGWVAFCGGPLVLTLIVLIVGLAGTEGLSRISGGLHGTALVFAGWEQLTGIGLALGLMALFSRRLNRDFRLLAWLNQRSFGVYVLHTPVLVGLTMLIRPLEAEIHPYLLAGLVALAGLVISYIAVDVIARIPVLRSFTT